jgi:hypothetical protein
MATGPAHPTSLNATWGARDGCAAGERDATPKERRGFGQIGVVRVASLTPALIQSPRLGSEMRQPSSLSPCSSGCRVSRASGVPVMTFGQGGALVRRAAGITLTIGQTPARARLRDPNRSGFPSGPSSAMKQLQRSLLTSAPKARERKIPPRAHRTHSLHTGRGIFLERAGTPATCQPVARRYLGVPTGTTRSGAKTFMS